MSGELALAIPLGLAVGLALGMLGAGGGVLTVPALVYLLDQPVEVATTASLAIVGTTAASGAYTSWREHFVDVPTAGLFVLGAVPLAVLGSIASTQVSDDAILLVLATLMLLAALALVKRPYQPPESARAARAIVPMGAATGFLTGLAGVGGGFLIVPALVLLAGLATQFAIGTSLVVIGVASAAGLVTRLAAVGELPLVLVTVLSVAGIIGARFGAGIGRRMDAAVLDRMFAGLLVVLAGVIASSIIF
ncbi:MAG: sulfite exporter TauE/SafE family protein [Thermoleophilia bacterium]|nr:sulfite exporter TauE/SafE family protein [Thermoleophilia bacterium]MDH3724879.1 sulfite exporter TauE/SafE family protein [Thermoleophilia bacterium]